MGLSPIHTGFPIELPTEHLDSMSVDTIDQRNLSNKKFLPFKTARDTRP